ncbi:MAG TPA: LysR family transcriptional regulator [Gaiellaceae bacterium]|nr:LysR family transcriptional regulator [Gaiellaceae bacterium]
MLVKPVVGDPDPARPGLRTMLDARRLIVLREVARLGSFSAAAHALWITQPAVSRQIAALERELGRKVLERTPRGLRLTDAGALLVEHAEAIVARLAAAEAQLGTLDRLESGRLRLGSSGAAAAGLLAGAMAQFRRRWPSVELSLLELPAEDPAGPVKAGELDLAVVFEGGLAPRPVDPELERVHLLDDPLLLALPAQHALSARERIDLRELADETWIRVQPEGPGVAHAACVAAGFEPRVRFDARAEEVALELVAAGLGVALVSSLAAAPVPEGAVVRDLGERAPTRRVVAVARPEAFRPPAAEAMLALVRERSAQCRP